MKKILTHRWFLGGLGVLALVLLVLLVGDLVAFADNRPLETRRARVIASLVLVAAWIIYEAARVLLLRRANRKMLDQMAAGPEDEGERRSREELAQLRERFEQASAVLSKVRSNGGGGRQYMVRMPWYMFIGAPGSGKTTALTRSGLRFPLAEGGNVEAIKGVGGTRNCDWWFTDEAVFLDTAGRYTTQDSEQKVDAAAWQGFLALLTKFRPGSPLNGAIVTLSLSDLLTQDEAQRNAYAAAVRSRVAELYERLGTRFPLYLVVTKADLLAGFSEYFADLGQEERAQVWGVTFPYREAAVAGFNFAQAFDSAFGGLERRLNAGLAERMQAERDPQRRAAIFGFPQQFSLAGPLVTQFIDQAFESSRFAQPPLLRGVYFTSGTQEGTPLDRVLGSLARSLGLARKVLAPPAASGKSYFLMRVLRDVVFPEAGLAGFNARRAQRRQWMVRGGLAAMALLTAGLLVAWGVSYSGNAALVKQDAARLAVVQAEAAALPAPRADDLAQALPLLNDARELPWAYAERARPVPLSLTFGLFQGDKLGEQAIVAYRRLLRDALLARVSLRLEQQIKEPPNNEILYEALKTYLMLHDDKRLDPEAVEAWVVADWGPRLGRIEGRDSRADLAGHIRAALERRPLELPAPPNQELVASARRQLAASSLADRVYSRIKLLGTGPEIAPFRLSEATGPAGAQVLARASGEPLSAPFPALYTRDGYLKSFKAQAEKVAAQMGAEERWVLGDQAATATPAARAGLVAEVKRRYLEDYAREWDKLLADIRLKPSGGLADTVLYARVLSGPDSPLRKLVAAVGQETTLAADKGAAEKAQDAIAGAARSQVLESARRVVGSVLGSAAPAIAAPTAVAAPELRVDQHFEPIRRMAGAPVDALLARLGDFYQELSALESGLRGGSAPVQGIASAEKLKADAAGLPPPLAGIIGSLLVSSSGQAAAAGGKTLEAGAQGASAFCDKAVSGRYPFVKSAQAEVTTEDFAAVFAPGGDLDKYFQANLASQVDMAGASWRARPGAQGAATISAATLRQFQNADTVRKAFFRGGQPAASADLVLVAADGGGAVFDYDGEQTKLAPGQGAIRLKWPAQRPAAQAKLSPAGGGAQVVGEGNWALFRLFDKAQLEPGATPERLRLNYQVDGKKLVLELRASSVLNPFRLGALESFQCPGRRKGA
ncbi:type VI secretion system membrane subunit TssM [Massilia sp. R2A-15]|uniref:type VI secretion system membrane subunit TssM n=1 Tax=Massilia sp. R2A-15 TaxID=3064278 RepID=UPI00273695E9|nr:type VI secretion system membrane subunit TssM [Massilia sp. R2A-15]WLI89447.1 type VI secretion system membrane subunit TssM [Massilia sp. R2A-15]